MVLTLGALSVVSSESAQKRASAQTSTTALIALIDAFDGVTGRFEQSILNSTNQVIEESSGSFALQRPKFRWQADSPFVQLIVANGTEMQIYDPDLAQVTLHEIDADIGPSPLTMLLGDTAVLASEFDVSRFTEGTEQKFLLHPRSQSSLFLQVELIFQGRLLDGLVIWDSAGQMTRFQFSQMQVAQRIEDDRFELAVPAGTDVIRG